ALDAALAVEEIRDGLAQARNGVGKLGRARGGFAEPERNRGWCALGVLDAHAPWLHLADHIALVAELEDVARHALDREILVDRPDAEAVRLEQHPAVGEVRNGAARRDGGELRAAPGPELLLDRIEVEVRATPP